MIVKIIFKLTMEHIIDECPLGFFEGGGSGNLVLINSALDLCF